jgi:hypothetical protein
MNERAHLLGGRLIIKSVPGEGSAIIVTFPLPPAASTSPVQENESDAGAADNPQPNSHNRETI